MPKGPRGEKRPADVIGAAIHVARIATDEEQDDAPARSAAAELGEKGGEARAKATTLEDYRTAILQREEIRARHTALTPLVDAMIAPASPRPAPLWSGDVPGQPLAKRPTGDAVYNRPNSALGAPVVTSP